MDVNAQRELNEVNSELADVNDALDEDPPPDETERLQARKKELRARRRALQEVVKQGASPAFRAGSSAHASTAAGFSNGGQGVAPYDGGGQQHGAPVHGYPNGGMPAQQQPSHGAAYGGHAMQAGGPAYGAKSRFKVLAATSKAPSSLTCSASNKLPAVLHKINPAIFSG